MTKILAPLSSVFVSRHSGLDPESNVLRKTMDPGSVPGVTVAPATESQCKRVLGDERRVGVTQCIEHLVSSIVRPVVRRDEYLVEGRVVHEVHLCVEEGASCSMSLAYRAHEKDADLEVRFFVTLEKNAELSLDIASFLLGERSKSDVRVFLVLNKGARATVRQLTHAEASLSTVHEEIRGLALDEYAHASFIPELELLHDDIVATHAASIVRIDEKRIAYLLARGVSREDAVGCVVEAFLGVGCRA